MKILNMDTSLLIWFLILFQTRNIVNSQTEENETFTSVDRLSETFDFTSPSDTTGLYGAITHPENATTAASSDDTVTVSSPEQNSLAKDVSQSSTKISRSTSPENKLFSTSDVWTSFEASEITSQAITRVETTTLTTTIHAGAILPAKPTTTTRSLLATSTTKIPHSTSISSTTSTSSPTTVTLPKPPTTSSIPEATASSGIHSTMAGNSPSLLSTTNSHKTVLLSTSRAATTQKTFVATSAATNSPPSELSTQGRHSDHGTTKSNALTSEDAYRKVLKTNATTTATRRYLEPVSNPGLTGGLVFAVLIGLLIMGGLIALFVWYVRNIRKHDPSRKYHAEGCQNAAYENGDNANGGELQNGSAPRQKMDLHSMFSIVPEHSTGHYDPAGNRRPKSRQPPSPHPPDPPSYEMERIDKPEQAPESFFSNQPEEYLRSDDTQVKTPFAQQDEQLTTQESQSYAIQKETSVAIDPDLPYDYDITENEEDDTGHKDEQSSTDIQVLGDVTHADDFFHEEKWAVSGAPDNEDKISGPQESETFVQTLRDSTEIEELDSKWDLSNAMIDKMNNVLITAPDSVLPDSSKEDVTQSSPQTDDAINSKDDGFVKEDMSQQSEVLQNNYSMFVEERDPTVTNNQDSDNRWAFTEEETQSTQNVIDDVTETVDDGVSEKDTIPKQILVQVQDARLEDFDDFQTFSSLSNENNYSEV